MGLIESNSSVIDDKRLTVTDYKCLSITITFVYIDFAKL